LTGKVIEALTSLCYVIMIVGNTVEIVFAHGLALEFVHTIAGSDTL
jgi:hypothetical protein